MTGPNPGRPRTIVSFHAHPDDEALLTGGTLAKAAAAGHRVVLVTATAGGAGLAASELTADGGLGRRRVAELEKAAAAIGAASVELLGYDDSGMDGRSPGDTFVRADVQSAALRLAAMLRREDADVLTVYDVHGGYGHPDHVQVHHVGVRATQLAGTPVVLEATIDRDLLARAVRLMRAVRLGARIAMPPLDEVYTPRSELTHRIDVRRHLPAKRAAMLAHASQATADGMDRTIALFLRLPPPLFRLVFGHEWFRQRGAMPVHPLATDILAGLARGSVLT
ncbi:MAG: PIG-L family deacetylase [Actinomycetes bacterium]